MTTIRTDTSTVDQPNPDLPPPVSNLVVTVRAPAAALSGRDGQIRATGMDGLFVADVRALTEVRLRFGDREPYPLTALPDGPGRSRFISVAHGFGDPLNDPTIRLDRLRELAPDGLDEQIRISSVATRTVRAGLTIDLRPGRSSGAARRCAATIPGWPGWWPAAWTTWRACAWWSRRPTATPPSAPARRGS